MYVNLFKNNSRKYRLLCIPIIFKKICFTKLCRSLMRYIQIDPNIKKTQSNEIKFPEM